MGVILPSKIAKKALNLIASNFSFRLYAAILRELKFQTRSRGRIENGIEIFTWSKSFWQ